MKTAMPFPSEPLAVAAAPLDPVAQAVADAGAAHKVAVTAARTKYEADAAAAWERNEAQRRDRFISAWKEDRPWNTERPRYKYQDWDNESIFRDVQEPAVRLDALRQAGLWTQYLKCQLVRAGGSASITQVKDWLRPYIPVDGDHTIRPNDTELSNLVRHGHPPTVKYAEGLSKELYEILSTTYLLTVGLGGRVEFDWRTEHNDRSSW